MVLNIDLKYWERHIWVFLFAISFAYPEDTNKISDEMKNEHYLFFKYLIRVMPNNVYKSKLYDITKNKHKLKLKRKRFDNRLSYTNYIYNLKMEMCKEFNIRYNLTYDEISLFYHTFDVGCPQKTCGQGIPQTDESGLNPSYWGPSLWMFLHLIAYVYDPSIKNNTDNYIGFYKYLGKVILCMYCKKDYNHIITEDPNLAIEINKNKIFKDNITLSTWTVDMHNHVNKKLNKDIVDDFDGLMKTYEKYVEK